MFRYCVAFFLAVLAATAVNAQFMINTPVAVQCEPTLITWAGGKAPYFLTVVPGGNPSAAAIVDLGQQTGTSVTWNTNVAAGTSLSLNLRDSTGTVAQSGIFTVQASTDTGCLGAGATSATSAATGGSTPTAPATTTGAGSTPTTRAATTAGGATTGTGAATTSPRPTTGSSNTSSGSRTLAQLGTVGVAAFVAALMA